MPENRELTKRLKKYSLIANVSLLVFCGVILLGWTLNIEILKNFFIYPSPVPFYTAAICMLSAISFFPQLSARKNVTLPFTYRLIPAISGGAALLTGLVGLGSYITGGGLGNILFSLIDNRTTILVAGFIFFLVGLAALASRIDIAHRFHIVQLFALMIIVISAIPLLGYVYQLVSPYRATNIMFLPANTAVLFILLGHAMLLRWPNRGFMGMFTLDSLSSVFALRLLVINVLLSPVIGFIVLSGAGRILYTFNEVLALLVIALILIASGLTWLNIKLLYKFEVEYLLMKEALRVHNIDLKMSNADLAGRMEDLEKTTEHYANSLKYQDKFRDMSESLG